MTSTTAYWEEPPDPAIQRAAATGELVPSVPRRERPILAPFSVDGPRRRSLPLHGS